MHHLKGMEHHFSNSLQMQAQWPQVSKVVYDNIHVHSQIFKK
jgi:hypothetical protein